MWKYLCKMMVKRQCKIYNVQISIILEKVSPLFQSFIHTTIQPPNQPTSPYINLPTYFNPLSLLSSDHLTTRPTNLLHPPSLIYITNRPPNCSTIRSTIQPTKSLKLFCLVLHFCILAHDNLLLINCALCHPRSNFG